MLNILSSPSHEPNPELLEEPRSNREDNIAWLNAHVGRTRQAKTFLVLVGGIDPIAFRLRVAQAHARDTFDPGTWSHVFIAAPPPFTPSTQIYEIPLSGITGFPPLTNGVQVGSLRAYRRSSDYPNIALLGLPVPWDETLQRLNLFATQRAVLDGLDLIVRWLAFVWGAGRAGNPLLEGFGVPSAAMIEVAMSAAGVDITPNVPNRASYPEAIWQAAKWWHGQHEERQEFRIAGAFTNKHRFGLKEPDRPLPFGQSPQRKEQRV
jgi:hypothetical protein